MNRAASRPSYLVILDSPTVGIMAEVGYCVNVLLSGFLDNGAGFGMPGNGAVLAGTA
jgi:hypothetical protein